MYVYVCMCHQYITSQEIAVNAILNKKEWESMPTGLFDQVRNFEKAFLQNNVFIASVFWTLEIFQMTKGETTTVCKPALLHC